VAHWAAVAIDIFNDGNNSFWLPQRSYLTNDLSWLDNTSSF
jgi:hypothetical protein